MDSQDRDYLIFLGKSYDRPLTRGEWDAIPGNPRSKDIITSLSLNNWLEYQEICGYESPPFSREDTIRYGKTIGISIENVTRQQWDEIANRIRKLGQERVPLTEDILPLFKGDWDEFKKEVKKSQGIKKDPSEIEKLFLAGLSLDKISEKADIKRKKLEKLLETRGLYTPDYIKTHFPSLDDITSQQILNLRFPASEDKKCIRELMRDCARDNLQSPLFYCGMPGANFIDYALLAKELGISAKKSLVAESDKLASNVMYSFIRNCSEIKGGDIFRGLHIYTGEISRALEYEKFKDMKFNFVNFDWGGEWSKDKESAIANAFKYAHIEDQALIFITLSDAFVEHGWTASGKFSLKHGGKEKHLDAAHRTLEQMANKYNFEMKKILELPLQDSADELALAGYFIKIR